MIRGCLYSGVCTFPNEGIREIFFFGLSAIVLSPSPRSQIIDWEVCLTIFNLNCKQNDTSFILMEPKAQLRYTVPVSFNIYY